MKYWNIYCGSHVSQNNGLSSNIYLWHIYFISGGNWTILVMKMCFMYIKYIFYLRRCALDLVEIYFMVGINFFASAFASLLFWYWLRENNSFKVGWFSAILDLFSSVFGIYIWSIWWYKFFNNEISRNCICLWILN